MKEVQFFAQSVGGENIEKDLTNQEPSLEPRWSEVLHTFQPVGVPAQCLEHVLAQTFILCLRPFTGVTTQYYAY